MGLSKSILISGGTGFLGSHLKNLLGGKNYKVHVLTRKLIKGNHEFQWDPSKNEIDQRAFEITDTIIHLAGTSIGNGRWTTMRKREIVNSRVQSASVIFDALKSRGSHSIKAFISASAIGIYGDTGDEWIDETHPQANDFLGDTCLQWESAANRFSELGIRVVILRIGIVLAKEDGALPQLALPVKLFAGSPLGTGKQFVSWIHVDDLCSAFTKAVEDEKMIGVYNAVAPDPVTNKEFMKSLAKALHRPLWPISVPSIILKILLGEKAKIVLDGQRVSPKKIQDTGFNFQFENLENALKNIYK